MTYNGTITWTRDNNAYKATVFTNYGERNYITITKVDGGYRYVVTELVTTESEFSGVVRRTYEVLDEGTADTLHMAKWVATMDYPA